MSQVQRTHLRKESFIIVLARVFCRSQKLEISIESAFLLRQAWSCKTITCCLPPTYQHVLMKMSQAYNWIPVLEEQNPASRKDITVQCPTKLTWNSIIKMSCLYVYGCCFYFCRFFIVRACMTCAHQENL